MALKRLSWKWKAAVAVLVLCLFMIGWLFSASGHAWMKAKIIAKYEELPASDQRDSPWADRYLTLAWWAGNIRGEAKEAMRMYEQFCGLGRDKLGNDFTVTGKFVGLCSPDGKTGWGPLHPRAPEAHWAYIELMDTETTASRQFIHAECFRFYRLFYTWCFSHSPDRKPHPNFSEYWQKIRERIARDTSVQWPPDVIPSAPGAPPPPKKAE